MFGQILFVQKWKKVLFFFDCYSADWKKLQPEKRILVYQFKKQILTLVKVNCMFISCFKYRFIVHFWLKITKSFQDFFQNIHGFSLSFEQKFWTSFCSPKIEVCFILWNRLLVDFQIKVWFTLWNTFLIDFKIGKVNLKQAFSDNSKHLLEKNKLVYLFFKKNLKIVQSFLESLLCLLKIGSRNLAPITQPACCGKFGNQLQY